MHPVSSKPATSYDSIFEDLEDLGSLETSNSSKVDQIFHGSEQEIPLSIPLEQRAISPHISEDPLASTSRVTMAAKRKFEPNSEEEKFPKVSQPSSSSHPILSHVHSNPHLLNDMTQNLLKAFEAFHTSNASDNFSTLDLDWKLTTGWMKAHYKTLVDVLEKEKKRGKFFEEQEKILEDIPVSCLVIDKRIKQLLPLARKHRHLYEDTIKKELLLTTSDKKDLEFIEAFNEMHALPLSKFAEIKHLGKYFKVKEMVAYYKVLKEILQKELITKMSDEELIATCKLPKAVIASRIELLLPLARKHPEFYLEAVPVIFEALPMATPVFPFPEFK